MCFSGPITAWKRRFLTSNRSRKMTKAKLLVFDWDGTLMDSENQIVSCMESAIEDLELETRTREEIKNIIGLGLKEAILTLFPSATEKFMTEFTACYRHYWFNSESGNLFPGARETLEVLRNEGFLLGLATGKGRRGLDKVLSETGLEDVFHATRCADEARSKPHPQMLEEIMQELSVPASATLMVGDTEYDLQMAQRAGVRAVAVTYGVHDWKRLQQFNPVATLEQIGEIMDWLAEERASTDVKAKETIKVAG